MKKPESIKTFEEYKSKYFPKYQEEILLGIKEPKKFGKELAKFCFQEAIKNI